MLIWINGPFGGGKTTTAFELARRTRGAVVCDPELVGFGLQHTIPAGLRPDFQDLAAWRSGVVEVLDHTLRHHDGPVIAPMTLVVPAYFEEVIGGLRGLGHDVVHVALISSHEEIRRRLHQRRLGGLHPGGASWALDQVDRCVEALAQPMFAEHLPTAGKAFGEVVDEVASYAGLELASDTDSKARAWLRRAHTSVRHMRMGWPV